MDTMTFCGNCGTDNPENNNFCCFCGSALKDSNEINASFNASVEERARIGAYDPNMGYGAAPAPVAPVPEQPAAPAEYQPQEPVSVYEEAPVVRPRNGMRAGGIILAIVTLGLTVALLFLIPLNITGWNMDTTLYQLAVSGTAKDLAVIGFIVAALAIGIFALIVPVFSLVSGATILAVIFALYYKYNETIAMTSNDLIIMIVLGLVVIILGVLASVMMSKYVQSVRRGVSMFSSCLFCWIGVPRKN